MDEEAAYQAAEVALQEARAGEEARLQGLG
jgi:hypothetical protein